MAWSFSPDRPVYIQLADTIRQYIISSEYSPGLQIPSVRQLAYEAAVNPNTVQRALLSLEEEGLLETRGTLGRFVTSDISIIERCREQNAKKIVAKFVDNAKNASMSNEQILEMVKEELYERS